MNLIPVADPKRFFQAHNHQIKAIMQDVLESGYWIQGERVNTFSKGFSAYCGVRHCIPVANGTDALEIAMRALNVVQGKEVITVANAGGYTTTAARILGATPVYVDINEHDLLADEEHILNAISPKTAAIVITHLYGRVFDVQTLKQNLEKKGIQIPIIEDCAQAHGAKIGPNRVGGFADLGVFSFYPTKNLGALGDAGAILTNQDSLSEQVKYLQQYGWDNRFSSRVPLGRNSRMDEIQAAILSFALPFLDERNQKRREIIDRYAAVAPSSIEVYSSLEKDFVGHLCVIKTPQRKYVQDMLKKLGIQTAVHYPILDYEQRSQKELPWRSLGCKISELAVQEILTIPCFPELTETEIDRVCEGLKSLDNPC